MRITKAAKTEVRLSQQDWVRIGEQAGWLKLAERDERSWVFINVPKSVIKLTASVRDIIDPDDVFEEDGNDHYGLEDDPHITVKWGLFTDDVEEIKEAIGDASGGSVELGETSLFEKDEYDVLKVTCTSKDLTKIHNNLESLKNDDDHPTYNIHITLAYLLPGKGKKYAGRTEFVGKTFNFNEVFFGDTEGKDTKIGLK